MDKVRTTGADGCQTGPQTIGCIRLFFAFSSSFLVFPFLFLLSAWDTAGLRTPCCQVAGVRISSLSLFFISFWCCHKS